MDIVVTAYHVSHLPVLVGNTDRNHAAAIVCQTHLHALAVLDGHEMSLLAVDC